MLAAILLAAMVSVTMGGVALGAAVVARHRAQAAADMAALAGAAHLAAGPALACRRAGQIAAMTGAVVRGCSVDGLDVVVTAAVRTGLRIGDAVAVARAGPVG